MTTINERPELETPDRKVLMSKELMDEFASRDVSGNLVRWDWHDPDDDGWYVPTTTIDRNDNLAAIETTRADEWEQAFRQERQRHEGTQAELAVERNRADKAEADAEVGRAVKRLFARDGVIEATFIQAHPYGWVVHGPMLPEFHPGSPTLLAAIEDILGDDE